MMPTESLLLVMGQTSDDVPHLFAVDKLTGRRVGQFPIPEASQYGVSSIVREGQQDILVQQPAGLMALTLP